MYFDQQTGASHTICWLNSSFSMFKHVFPSFFVTNRKKQARGHELPQCCTMRTRNVVRRFHHPGSTPGENVLKKIISTSKRHGKHPFAGWNTQQLRFKNFKKHLQKFDFKKCFTSLYQVDWNQSLTNQFTCVIKSIKKATTNLISDLGIQGIACSIYLMWLTALMRPENAYFVIWNSN